MTEELTQATILGDDMNAHTSEYLTFVLADEEYGVEILRVQGIQGWDKVTPIPNTPDYILGVINLRGAIVPIIDLRQRFGLEKLPFGPTTVVIVVQVSDDESERTVGMVVDAVSEVYRLDDKQMQPPPDFGSAVSTEFVKSLTTVDEKMVIILDIDRLVNLGLIVAVTEHEAA